MRDPMLSEVDRVAHQEVAVSAIGARDCPRPRQDEYPLPEWGHHSTARGLRGIPVRPP